MDCLFCRIAAGLVPADIVYQDADATAFRDIAPEAPTHLVVVPNRHVASLDSLDEPRLAAALLAACRAAAAAAGLGRGYRLVINTGPDAGQVVQHLHCHVLGGRPLGWPPG